jgi:hypothetical protein
MPPLTTRVSAKSGPDFSTFRRSRPSSSSRSAPGLSAAKISGCGSGARFASPGGGPVEIEPERLAFDQLHRAVPEGADAQLRTLEVEEHADRLAEVAFDGADQVEPLLVIGMGAVAEVEPEHVGAGAHQRLDGAAVRARRPEGRDDLGVAGTLH